MKGDCNICANGKLPDMSRTCAECGLSRKNYKPMTNADRIRAMSDEELAERIETIADCNHCPILEKVQKKPIRETCRGEKAVSRYSCMKHWLDWLREESTT